MYANLSFNRFVKKNRWKKHIQKINFPILAIISYWVQLQMVYLRKKNIF